MTQSPTTPANPAQAEKLGRFGHHPDPATDFETEVHDIECEVYHHRVAFLNGTPPLPDLIARIERAMEFQVGGVETAVAAKQRLRELEKEAAALSPVNPAQVTDASEDRRQFKNFHRLLCERFGYTHDERDWFRDQVSLIEHIAAIGAGGQAVAWRYKSGVGNADSNWLVTADQKLAETERRYPNIVEPLYTHPAPSGQAVTVKPLDLSNLLKHAFSAGYVSAAGDDGWTDYDPTKCAAYSRILSALAHPVQPGWRELREAFEAARYVPGDHPIVPVKIDRFMKTVERLLSADQQPGWQQVGWAYNDRRWDEDRWHVCGMDSKPRPAEGRSIEPIFIAAPQPKGE